MPFTFAIGDIHGCIGLLRALMVRIEREAAGEAFKLVFIGDYIDRGPDSRAVVEELMALQQRMGDDVVFLMGNHEEQALYSVEHGTHAGSWMFNGGDTTLADYRISEARDLPVDHVAWLRALRLTHDDGRRLFVHAGVDPARPLDDQDPRDLVWIRQPFLSDPRDYGRLIVHGHTPQRTGKPDLRANRLNIDTAAVYGGALTAAVFTDAQTMPVKFLQVEA
jgi:diadenosine tetraphosphatase ApaH/serine/threonine PP2A family protein phosphatase